ncbi:MAG TPA: branched-chain amino acid ABC transporter permease [Thermoanaerobaculia bacterium]|nr:branched-chain amino acid ABC transporter permease [Thermoanaerobaculia bacterium]
MRPLSLKRDYYEDIQLLRTGASRVWFVLLLAALAIFPFLASSYQIYTVSLMAVNVIVALGLNILVGYTGQISLGHAGFVAIGAYGTVILATRMGVPYPLALVAAGLSAAGVGLLLGLPALRLEGPYLAIATLGFGMATTILIGRTAWFGGHMGLVVPQVSGDRGIYAMTMTATVILTLAARNLMRSRVGRAFQAIRDSDIAAAMAGVDVARYKTLSFAVSAFYAGVAGGLWAAVLGFINPGMFTFVLSVLFLAMVVVGGLGTILGAIAGAVTLTWLNLQASSVQTLPLVGPALEAFSQRFMTVSGLPNITWIITGLVLIFIVILEPLGLYGLWLRAKIYWRTWPF